MTDLKKIVEAIQNDVDVLVRKTVKSVEKGTRNVSSTIATEQKKVAIRSQIGQHQRNATKAYARLGEAYYNYVEKGVALTGIEDVLDILRSNNKVIELLQAQLQDLEKE